MATRTNGVQVHFHHTHVWDAGPSYEPTPTPLRQAKATNLDAISSTLAMVVADDDGYPDPELELQAQGDHLVTVIAPRTWRGYSLA